MTYHATRKKTMHTVGGGVLDDPHFEELSKQRRNKIMQNAITLATVHTHTHTLCRLETEKTNKNINKHNIYVYFLYA